METVFNEHNMREILKSKIWQLFLAIAFLSMQSASAHIHLASSHDHDGHDHSHSQVIHAHDVSSHHVDAFESELESHTSQAVELCQDGIVKYGKKLSDLESHAFLVSSFSSNEQSIVPQSYFDNSLVYRRFHFLSKVQARAPPALFPSYV